MFRQEKLPCCAKGTHPAQHGSFFCLQVRLSVYSSHFFSFQTFFCPVWHFFETLCEIFQGTWYIYILWTDFCTFAASYTGRWFFFVAEPLNIHGCVKGWCGPHLIVRTEQRGNVQLFGHPSQQYLQAVQGIISFMPSAMENSMSFSSADSGFSSENVRMLSCICSISDIPLSTTVTPGISCRNLKPQDATESSGRMAFNLAASFSSRRASFPPRTGSMTQMGIFRLERSSHFSLASCNDQSR